MTTQVILQAEADTCIRTDLDIRRNDNYGLQHYAYVGTSRGGGGIPWGDADAMRTLLSFDQSDLSSIQGNIESATLQLTVIGIGSGTGSSVFNVDVHQILDSWIEGNGMEDEQYIPYIPGSADSDGSYGVAWAGAGDNPDPSAANNDTQPNFDSLVVASATVQQGVDNPGDVIEWDITSLIQGWQQGTIPNHGLMLVDPTSDGSFRELAFGTREGDLYPEAYSNEVTGPRLIINISDINGTDQDDVLNGTPGDDNILGYAGNDLLLGLGGQDILDGGADDDTLKGGSGNDQLLGETGQDRLFGQGGNDTLTGGGGNDKLFGGGNNDTLIGVDPDASYPGEGERDILRGNSGADLFVLGNESTPFYNIGVKSQAIIQDFDRGIDTIQLSGVAADYRFTETGIGDTKIFYKPLGEVRDLIGIVKNTIGLDSSDFSFV